MKKTLKKPLIDEDGEVRELNAGDFKHMRPAREVLHEIMPKEVANEMLKPQRGRPLKPVLKKHINIRVDADILSAFKSTGRGWQSRMNEALRDWIKWRKSA
ncbi:MAG: BrnA antitoxin family protein [Nitrospirae bacterium]|nr:BrnA antitoxin family protein [Nitrospirota bacterium]